MYPSILKDTDSNNENRVPPRLPVANQFLRAALLTLIACILVVGQSGVRSDGTTQGGVLLSVFAKRDRDAAAVITSKQLGLFDNGVQQDIKTFSRDPAPARIVLLVDNSLTIRADVDRLEEAAREFAYEIFEGDKLLIVGYDEQAEIVTDWTDDSKAIESSLKAFRKKGEPHLFDALFAVADQALRPLAGQKRVVVVISDGLDRGSKTTFDQILAELQRLDITVYCVQAPDQQK
jgi:Ca-activated chloride channel homolog